MSRMRICRLSTSSRCCAGKSRESPAHRFQLHSQVTADLGARHAQVELDGRVAARLQALGQVQQEGGQPLLGVHAAQQHHETVLAHDLPAHQPADCTLQIGALHRQLVEVGVRDRADFGVLQRDGAAGMRALREAIQTHEFTCHVKATDLLPAVGERQTRLESAHAHRVDVLELVAFAVQGLSSRHAPTGERQAVQSIDVASIHSARQAEVAQVASRASCL